MSLHFLALANSPTQPSLAINPNPDGTWTAYDYAAGGWSPGITQRSGSIGIGMTDPRQKLEVNGAARLVPSGAPSAPTAGAVYFDASAKHFFGFDGTNWKQLDN